MKSLIFVLSFSFLGCGSRPPVLDDSSDTASQDSANSDTATDTATDTDTDSGPEPATPAQVFEGAWTIQIGKTVVDTCNWGDGSSMGGFEVLVHSPEDNQAKMDILDYNLDCAFQDWDFDCLSEMESTVTENAVSATFTYEYQMAGRLTGDVFDADWTQRITKCESKSATACAMFEDILEIPVVPCAWAQKVQGTRD